jgi:hypothetical protein
MYTFLMDALCLECHSDLLLTEGANIEAVVESTVGLILLDFLGGVIAFDELTVSQSSTAPRQVAEYRLRIRATSFNEDKDLSLERLAVKLDEAICCAFLEHFHIVVIEAIDVQASAQ